MLLTSAERAWARAQEAKAALEAGAAAPGAARRAAASRAARAARWASDLAAAAAAAGDARTLVECASYASWLAGASALERGEWGAARRALARARALCEKLAASGPPDARAAARAQVADLEPSVRFAGHQLEREGDGGGKESSADPADPPALAAALDALDAAAGPDANSTAATDADAASGHATFTWRGVEHAVPGERARAALAAARAAEARAAASADPATRLAAMDDAAVAFGDAKAAARAAAAAVPAGDARGAAAARGLALALAGASLERSLERSAVAAAILTAKLDAGGKPERGAGGKKGAPTPEDAVRLFTSQVKTAKLLGDVAAQAGGASGELLLDEAAARGADARARRAFWAARAFLAAGKHGLAAALFDRAAQRAGEAAEAHADTARPDAAALESLDALADACAAWRCVAVADAAAVAGRAAAEAVGGVAAISLAGGARDAASAPPTRFLADTLYDWESFASGGPANAPRLAPVPPRPEAVPVRPFVLDLAYDSVPLPAFPHRLPAPGEGAGLLGKLAGGLGGLWGGAK